MRASLECTQSPVAGVRTRVQSHRRHVPWSAGDVAAFEHHHPVGSTGSPVPLPRAQHRPAHLRPRADRPQACEGQRAAPRPPTRTATASRNALVLPILPGLRRVLDVTEIGATAFLVTEKGQPFASPAALGNKVRDWVKAAGLSSRSAHGLRKMRGDDPRRARCDPASTAGDLWMDVAQARGGVHAHCREGAACRRCDAVAGNRAAPGETKEDRAGNAEWLKPLTVSG